MQIVMLLILISLCLFSCNKKESTSSTGTGITNKETEVDKKKEFKLIADKIEKNLSSFKYILKNCEDHKILGCEDLIEKHVSKHEILKDQLNKI